MRMMWSRAHVCALVAVVAVAVGLFGASNAEAGGPTIKVSPAFQNVAAGGTVNVNILVQGAPTFAAYEFHLSYNPRYLEYVSISGGGNILENAGRDPLCLGPDQDDLDNAVVSYGCASTGGSGGPSGSGTLATVRFRARCAGTSDLNFVPGGADQSVDAVSLANTLGNSIATTGVGGEVNINGTPCPTTNVRGDSDCSGTVNAVDAAIDLQINAGLLGSAPCPSNADANRDGNVNAVDAALVLQFAAGLISAIP